MGVVAAAVTAAAVEIGVGATIAGIAGTAVAGGMWGAAIGGVMAGISGGDIGQGMLNGGVSGFVTAGVGGALGSAVGSAGGLTGSAMADAALVNAGAGMAGGATNSLMSGTDPLQGLLMGGLGGAVTGAMSGNMFGAGNAPVNPDSLTQMGMPADALAAGATPQVDISSVNGNAVYTPTDAVRAEYGIPAGTAYNANGVAVDPATGLADVSQHTLASYTNSSGGTLLAANGGISPEATIAQFSKGTLADGTPIYTDTLGNTYAASDTSLALTGQRIDAVGNPIYATSGLGNTVQYWNGDGRPVTSTGDIIGTSQANASSGLFGGGSSTSLFSKASGALSDVGSAIGLGPSNAAQQIDGSLAALPGGSTVASNSSTSNSSSGGIPGLSNGAMLTYGAGNLISSLLGSSAAEQAASIQSDAAKNATASQQAMQAQTRADLMPYQSTGLAATNALTAYMGLQQGQDPTQSLLLSKFNPTQAQLAATPGYQWSLDQGLQATQNAAAAQGLGASGSALKGAANYAEGLAGTTYQQQFANDQTTKNQQYNQLSGLMSSGQNAAAQTGNFGYQNTQAANNYATSGAAAQAAGVMGSNNAITGGINNMGNMLMMNSMLSSMYG